MDGPMGHADTAVDHMMDGPMGHADTAVDCMMYGLKAKNQIGELNVGS